MLTNEKTSFCNKKCIKFTMGHDSYSNKYFIVGTVSVNVCFGWTHRGSNGGVFSPDCMWIERHFLCFITVQMFINLIVSQ